MLKRPQSDLSRFYLDGLFKMEREEAFLKSFPGSADFTGVSGILRLGRTASS